MSITLGTISPHYAIYTRMLPDLPVSTAMADEKRLEDFIALVGRENVVVYVDSAGLELQRMLEDVRNEEFDHNFTHKLCR